MHELADLVHERPAVLAPGLDRRAQAARLQLAGVHREDRTRADEGRAQIGTAAGREEPDVRELLVDPLEALGGERGAGRADAPQLRRVRRDHPGLHRRGDEAGARPERRDLRLGGELPQPLGIGLTVVEHDRGARQQPADQEVPHHPAGGGEPEEAIARPEIAVQPRLLQVLEQDAALPLDDRLRQPRGAGRVEHPERVVEGQALEAELGGLGEQLVPAARHQHRVLDRRDRGHDLGHTLAAVEVAPAVAVALGGDQDLRLDLLEAVDDGGRSELGRAARPDGADARAGQERHDGLGHVRHVRRHAVAALHPESAQPGGAARHLIRELVPGQLAERLGLRGVHDRGLPRPRPAEQVLGVVQLAHPGTTRLPASRADPARSRTERRSRTSPRALPRSRRGPRPTSATARRSRRTRAPA